MSDNKTTIEMGTDNRVEVMKRKSIEASKFILALTTLMIITGIVLLNLSEWLFDSNSWTTVFAIGMIVTFGGAKILSTKLRKNGEQIDSRIYFIAVLLGGFILYVVTPLFMLVSLVDVLIESDVFTNLANKIFGDK